MIPFNFSKVLIWSRLERKANRMRVVSTGMNHEGASFGYTPQRHSDHHSTEVIRETLTNILANARFASSPQMSAFLRYVVEEAVAGKADRIKAYSVAVDALGKPESFDAQRDPCVRVLALRLRNSLADYYQEHDEPVVFTIPRGSYKPNFVFAVETATSLAGKNPRHEDSTLDKTEIPDESLISTTLTTISNAEPPAPDRTFLSHLRSRHWITALSLLMLGCAFWRC